MISRPYY